MVYLHPTNMALCLASLVLHNYFMLWNFGLSLPGYIVNADSLNSFKDLLDKHWNDYH